MQLTGKVIRLTDNIRLDLAYYFCYTISVLKGTERKEPIMMKPLILISPAQSAALLSAYHVLDEIVTDMEKHNTEHLSSCACLTAARDGLYNILIEDDTVLWDGDAVVLNEKE